MAVPDSNLSIERTLDDSDLRKIFERAMQEGSLSPVDFMNCSSEDLDALFELFDFEFKKLGHSDSDIQEKQRISAVLTNIADKLEEFSLRRVAKMQADSETRIAEMEARVDSLVARIHKTLERIADEVSLQP